MTNINQVIIEGNLGSDIKVETVKGESKVANFSIAVNFKSGETQKTNWFNITAWNKGAEIIASSVKKGDRVLIEGYLSDDSFEKDGNKISRVSIVMNNFRKISLDKATE